MNVQGFASDLLSSNYLNIHVFIWASVMSRLCTQIILSLPTSGRIRRASAFPLGVLCQLAVEMFAVFCRLTAESKGLRNALWTHCISSPAWNPLSQVLSCFSFKHDFLHNLWRLSESKQLLVTGTLEERPNQTVMLQGPHDTNEIISCSPLCEDKDIGCNPS